MSVHPEIEQVLDQYVRPVLAAHGGSIGWYSFQNGEFRFRFSGECALCPSAWITAEQVVTTVLMLHLPQVERVIMEQGVNTSLLQYATSLMKGEHEGKKAGSGLSPEREEGSFCAE